MHSSGPYITAHLHIVQDTSGQWCVERVMERETLSNNTEYQERLREGRIKGVSLLQYVRQLQQQITEVSVVRSRYSQYC